MGRGLKMKGAPSKADKFICPKCGSVVSEHKRGRHLRKRCAMAIQRKIRKARIKAMKARMRGKGVRVVSVPKKPSGKGPESDKTSVPVQPKKA
jgi:predicted RNA-binding Zn-ribbon protein involved in translation (DUF1610 family)